MMTDREELLRLIANLDKVTHERDQWKKQAEELEDELSLAREALKRAYS